MQPRIISEAQRAASRQNGRRSRGPVTPEGKHHSSRNAISHGLLADTIVLDNEDRRAFLSLLETLKRAHKPQDETEHIHVETVAAATWRLGRLRHIERNNLQMEMHKALGVESPLESTQSGLATVAFRNMVGPERIAELIPRYESHLDRLRTRALNLLAKKQAGAKRTRELGVNTDLLTSDPTDRSVPLPPSQNQNHPQNTQPNRNRTPRPNLSRQSQRNPAVDQAFPATTCSNSTARAE